MEEREALKRQIELLQNLINNHKSVHGDTPCARDQQRHPTAPTSARGRSHSTSAVHPHSSRGGLYAPQSRGGWRKTYSLSNKHPQSSVRHPIPTSSSVHQFSSVSSTSLPSHSKGEKSGSITTASLVPGIPEQTQDGRTNSIMGRVATDEKHTDTLRNAGGTLSQHGDEKEDSSSAGTDVQHNRLHRQTEPKTESRSTDLPEKLSGSSEIPSPVKANTSTILQSKAPVTKSNKETKRTLTATVTANTTPPLPAPSNVSKQSSNNPGSYTSQGQVSASFVRKSKFTWVKSQNVGGVERQQASSVSSPTRKAVTVASTSVSQAGVAGRTSPSFLIKRTPGKKLPRKLSLVNVAPKSSKYRWVSSSAGAQTKTPRKVPSPKAPQRALEKGEVTKKLRSLSTPSAKMKKAAAGPSTSSSLSSRYRWKAGGQSTSAAGAGGATVARRRSAFHWTSEKSTKGVKGGLIVSPLGTQRSSPMSSPSTGGFKLRSRMKIIRKSANSGGGSEKGTSPPAVRLSPRGRMHSSTRRTPTRELVSFGRHKLRRLSPSSSRTSATSSCSSHRSSASQRVFRTRYKMVTRPGSSTGHTLHYNPTLSWRAKRIQSARSFLQSRMRAPHDRHPSSTHHWRGSSMCWIRGSLYRVSANKLSRTVASNMSINRTGRSFSTTQASPTSPAFSRPFSSRHLASRAVQRSLAIIRHARQKKPQKQYCMYYNRFGKCNRGNSCPYIHDPDKVAVCTRFLRGTCKQAGGTCPFSHKVAKEKMPVCSYFLKGICNNSDCPYSHVYVSRKAEVCEDFVKGYCPDGEKCKKKHTLVCPDFSKTGSCPRGARCKLQHRQRAKRSASNGTTTSAKRRRTKEPSKRPRLSVVMPQGSQAALEMPTKNPLVLPSFISLSSSPEEADTPDALPTLQVKEKKLQIKPRL